mmetsp:Transcript_11548/g.31121  ORF Transcript_11548/g.31121 Transcript_11548/m.31121 type:complete len:398 (-) Transcript_11548:573-1766(-)
MLPRTRWPSSTCCCLSTLSKTCNTLLPSVPGRRASISPPTACVWFHLQQYGLGPAATPAAPTFASGTFSADRDCRTALFLERPFRDAVSGREPGYLPTVKIDLKPPLLVIKRHCQSSGVRLGEPPRRWVHDLHALRVQRTAVPSVLLLLFSELGTQLLRCGVCVLVPALRRLLEALECTHEVELDTVPRRVHAARAVLGPRVALRSRFEEKLHRHFRVLGHSLAVAERDPDIMHGLWVAGRRRLLVVPEGPRIVLRDADAHIIHAAYPADGTEVLLCRGRLKKLQGPREVFVHTVAVAEQAREIVLGTFATHRDGPLVQVEHLSDVLRESHTFVVEVGQVAHGVRMVAIRRPLPIIRPFCVVDFHPLSEVEHVSEDGARPSLPLFGGLLELKNQLID